MRIRLPLGAMLVALALVPAGCAFGGQSQTEAPAMSFQLTSAAFPESGTIPARHTCDGDDSAVPVEWSGLPEGTVELALVLDDPDARGFVHWVVVGIPASAGGLAGSGLPSGAREGRNDFGSVGYRGPCPPSGSHRYVLTVYALSAALQVPDTPSADDVRRAAAGITLDEATLSASYARS